MSAYPPSLTQIDHVAPAPRRVRGIAGGTTIFDTVRALYVWERPEYPQYYIPRCDVRMDLLVSDGERIVTPQGDALPHSLRSGGTDRRHAARLVVASPVGVLFDTVRFVWNGIESWYEEDEEIFVHPRSPYTRVDSLRSRRTVRVELDGVVLAQSASPVMLFETGLPTRYYMDRGDVNFAHLVASSTRTQCPYKGRTTGYWSVHTGATTYADLAWMYSFPTREALPIAGLVAFLNENVDLFIDGVPAPRPVTHMSS